MAGRKWTDFEIQFIKGNYYNTSCRDMGLCLNRTERAVEHISAKLNLIREPSIGDEFGRLIIRDKITEYQNGQNITFAICDCSCGTKNKKIRLTVIKKGRNISCGCWKAEKARERTIERNYKHGQGNHSVRLFRIWSAMKTRCFNSNIKEFHNYGGRGITICAEWLKDFIVFRDWSLANGYSDDLSIDRINVNGNYEPSNCRWATNKEQAKNRRNNRQDTIKITAFGETKAAINWLDDERCKVKSIYTIIYRIGVGLSPEEAISKVSERKIRKQILTF